MPSDTVPEIKSWIGIKIGELVAFIVGYDANSDQQIPIEGTDKQEKAEDIREVDEPEQSEDSKEVSSDTEG